MIIDNWRDAPRMLSVWAATLAVAWGSLPVDMQTAALTALHLPPERVPAVLGLLMLAGRLIKQPTQPKE